MILSIEKYKFVAKEPSAVPAPRHLALGEYKGLIVMKTIYCIKLNETVYQICLDEKYISRRFNPEINILILPCSPFEEIIKGIRGREDTKKKVYIKGFPSYQTVYDGINDTLVKTMFTHGNIPDLQMSELIENLKLKKLDEFCQENYK